MKSPNESRRNRSWIELSTDSLDLLKLMGKRRFVLKTLLLSAYESNHSRKNCIYYTKTYEQYEAQGHTVNKDLWNIKYSRDLFGFWKQCWFWNNIKSNFAPVWRDNSLRKGNNMVRTFFLILISEVKFEINNQKWF